MNINGLKGNLWAIFTSNMLIPDVEDNPNDYKMGDFIRFCMKYMDALSIMNSDYIDKIVE